MIYFEKVSFEQWSKDYIPDSERIYADIKLPSRGTEGSAGYDFFAPFDISIEIGETCLVPTGIRAFMDDRTFLMIVPRSSLGFKYQVRLANTCGIIDKDYVDADNEGHIFIKLVNGGPNRVNIQKGAGIAQGIFIPFFSVDNDDTTTARTGGIGSTDAIQDQEDT